MRPTTAIAVALLLTFVSVLPAAFAKEGGADPGRKEDRRKESWERLSPEQRQKGLEQAEKHGLFARFNLDEATGNVQGRYLSFHIVTGTAAIHNVVSIDGDRPTRFLDAAEAEGANGGSVQMMGAILRDDAGAVELTAHNNPTGGITWKAGADVTLRFRLAPGAEVANGTDAREVRFSVGGPHAHLLTNGAAGFDRSGPEVTVRLAEGEMASFRAHPAGDALLHQQNDWFKAGKLGAQLRIAEGDGMPVEDGTEMDVRAMTKEIKRGRVVVEIESDQHEARMVVVAVDGATLDGNGTITASLNGTDLARASDAATVQPGQFAVVKAPSGKAVTVLVFVPHFSSFALAIASTSAGGAQDGTSAGSTSASSGAPGPGLALAALALVAVAIALRRRA